MIHTGCVHFSMFGLLWLVISVMAFFLAKTYPNKKDIEYIGKHMAVFYVTAIIGVCIGLMGLECSRCKQDVDTSTPSYCVSCSEQVDTDVNFCSNCGAKQN